MTGQLPARWQPGYIFSAEAQPNGTLVAAACSDGILRVWDSRSGHLQKVCNVPLYRGMTAACAWDADGNCVASVATGGDIVVLVRKSSCGAMLQSEHFRTTSLMVAWPDLLSPAIRSKWACL